MSFKKVESVNRAIAGTVYNLAFDVGRVSDYNIHARDVDVPIAWMVPQPYSMNPIEVKMNRMGQTHNVEIFFYKRSKMSNNNDELFQIIKDMDDVCLEFCIKMQDLADSNDIEVSNFQVSPIYYNHAKGLVSGVLLNYTFFMPDDFEYC